MKSSGIVRKIDDLGRVVIPAEIRRTVGIREGDPLEIIVEGRKVIFEKYFPFGQFSEQAREYVRSFQGVAHRHVFISDTEKIIASVLHNFSNAPLSAELIEAIRNKTDIESIPLQDGETGAVVEYAAIIRDGSRDSLGEGIGAVILVQDESPVDEAIKTQAKIAADFLGRLANTN